MQNCEASDTRHMTHSRSSDIVTCSRPCGHCIELRLPRQPDVTQFLKPAGAGAKGALATLGVAYAKLHLTARLHINAMLQDSDIRPVRDGSPEIVARFLQATMGDLGRHGPTKPGRPSMRGLSSQVCPRNAAKRHGSTPTATEALLGT
jgi:hypothetical protein